MSTTEPTPLWVLLDRDGSYLRDSQGNVHPFNHEPHKWRGLDFIKLVPAGSERSAIVRRLRERVANIIRVRETHRTGADFWLILEGKRMELESLIRELEASEEPHGGAAMAGKARKRRKRMKRGETIYVDGPATIQASRRVVLTVKTQAGIDRRQSDSG